MLKKRYQSIFMLYWAFLSWQLLTPNVLVSGSIFDFDKLIHLGAFFILSVLALKVWARQVLYLLVAYAAFTEIAQHFIPGRSFSILDWLADCSGLLVGWWFYRSYKVFHKQHE